MTKKCLVSFELDKRVQKQSNFLCPVYDAGQWMFLGLKTKKIYQMGMVVYTGVDLFPEDIFSELVDTGVKINNVDETIKNITEYLEALREQRIGSVVTVDKKDNRIMLIKTDIKPFLSERPRLP